MRKDLVSTCVLIVCFFCAYAVFKTKNEHTKSTEEAHNKHTSRYEILP